MNIKGRNTKCIDCVNSLDVSLIDIGTLGLGPLGICYTNTGLNASAAPPRWLVRTKFGISTNQFYTTLTAEVCSLSLLMRQWLLTYSSA